MPQKCPYWDIFGLHYCRLHQSQIPNVLPVDGVELNRRFLNSPFPLVSEVTKAFAKGKIQAFLPLNSFGRILIRITMHSVPKHEIWFKKFLDSMFNFAHYINPDKKCLKK